MSRPIGVFIVDDSAVVRQILSALFSGDPSVRLIGTAPDPLFALQKMERDWPDVIVLDIEMPRMDGITFLKKLMQERPTPVVICSTLTERGAAATVQALAAGAVDIVAKPKIGLKDFLESSSQTMLRIVKAAANAHVPRSAAPAVSRSRRAVPSPVRGDAGQIVALGTSTGGTQALEFVLTQLPGDCPAVLVVQHMPEKFTAAFAHRLNNLCQCEVREACDGDRLRAGSVLIAPGGRHMQVRKQGTSYVVSVADGPPVNRHKPSVDVLFMSVARAAGASATGIIMTGMGDDGARGLLAMKQAGANTIAQDEQSCVVFGMPREAIELGAARQVLSLTEIGMLMSGSTRAAVRR